MKTMKVFLKNVLSICLAASVLLTVLPCPALALDDGEFKYTIQGSEVYLTRYIGDGGDVQIPASINGIPVTKINGNCFIGNETVTSISIPGSVKTIEDDALASAHGVTKLTIAEGVTSIGDKAFEKMENLVEANIPSSAANQLGAWLFSGCKSLQKVSLPEGMPEIPMFTFDGCGSLETIDIPDSVTRLGAQSFRGTALKEVTIPANVTGIMNEVFAGCRQLEKVTFAGNNVEVIEYSAFDSCKSLKHLELPTSLRRIGGGAFWASGLTGLIIPYGVTELEGNIVYQCGDLQWMTVPSTVTKIEDNDFGDYTPNLVVYCTAGSAAERACKAYETPYLIDSSADSQIQVMYNGNRVSFGDTGQNPIMENDRTLVPLRAVFEAMGAEVMWDEAMRKITAVRGNTTIELTLGDTTLYKNGKAAMTLDVPAKTLNDRTMVPVRAIAESFGAQVDWIGPSQIVVIYESDSALDDKQEEEHSDSVSADQPDTGNPETKTIDIYAGPGEDYAKLGAIASDEIDSYCLEDGSWIEVEYGNNRAYVREDDLEALDKNGLPYVSRSVVSGPTQRPYVMFFDGLEYTLTCSVDVYSGPDEASAQAGTLSENDTVAVLHEMDGENAVEQINPFVLIEYEGKDGKARGYVRKNMLLDSNNPLRGFDKVKQSNAAFTYNGKTYYSTVGAPSQSDSWMTDFSDSLTQVRFNWLDALTGAIASNEGGDSLENEIWLYDAKAGGNVAVDVSTPAAEWVGAASDLLGMVNAALAAGNDSIALQVDLESCEGEGRMLVRGGSPFEAPLAGKTVSLASLIAKGGALDAVTSGKQADEMIRKLYPGISGSEKCSMTMTFSKDYKDNPYGYSYIIGRDESVFARLIFHSGTRFDVYQGGEYVGDIAPYLSGMLMEVNDKTASRILEVLSEYGIEKQ